MLLNLDASDWLLVAPALMPLLLIDFGAIVALIHHKLTRSSPSDRLTREDTHQAEANNETFWLNRCDARSTVPVEPPSTQSTRLMRSGELSRTLRTSPKAQAPTRSARQGCAQGWKTRAKACPRAAEK